MVALAHLGNLLGLYQGVHQDIELVQGDAEGQEDCVEVAARHPHWPAIFDRVYDDCADFTQSLDLLASTQESTPNAFMERMIDQHGCPTADPAPKR
jgi:hypothetical protein